MERGTCFLKLLKGYECRDQKTQKPNEQHKVLCAVSLLTITHHSRKQKLPNMNKHLIFPSISRRMARSHSMGGLEAWTPSLRDPARGNVQLCV